MFKSTEPPSVEAMRQRKYKVALSPEELKALEITKRAKGKIKSYPTVNIRNEADLAAHYVPGCTIACREIAADRECVYEFTGRDNRLAIICNGTAVLGLGNVGPYAALPVIEGKSLLMRLFGDINSLPIVIDTNSADDVIAFGKMIAPTVGAINIEDVSSPDTFTVVRELSKSLDIPVFCDDQQGSAVIVLSAVKNVLRLTGMSLKSVKIVILGAGAAGVASANLLLLAGAQKIVVLNENGILCDSNGGMDEVQAELATRTNPDGLTGGLNEAIAGANILVGLSRGNVVEESHIRKMGEKAAVFALALPEPEITREKALDAGAYIYASGVVQNQNAMLNVHAFPGMVRGALDVRARRLTNGMLLAAADALSGVIDDRRLTPNRISPAFFGQETTPRIAEAVAQAAVADGVAALPLAAGDVYTETWKRLYGDVAHI